MAEVGIRALKQNASAVVAQVATGELVTITDRGRPVAQMVPITSTPIEGLIAIERARPALRKLSNLPEPARRRSGRPALSEEVERARGAERY